VSEAQAKSRKLVGAPTADREGGAEGEASRTQRWARNERSTTTRIREVMKSWQSSRCGHSKQG